MECACGCGETIQPKPWYTEPKRAIRYIAGHQQRLGLTKGRRWGSKRVRIIVGGQTCACGCSQWVAEFFNGGAPRYSTTGAFYASKSCRPRLPRAKRAHQERRISYYGYVLLYLPDHPSAQKDGWVPEHRVVWEAANNRRLQSTEDVHHRNGDKTDNRSGNLLAPLTRSQHQALHMGKLTTEERQKRTSIAGRKGAEVRWRSH